MSNGNLFFRIMSILLSFTIVPCLIVNLLMFFGVDVSYLLKPFSDLAGINPDDIANHWDFENYYFGFQSLVNWFSDFPPVLTLEHLLSILNEFLSSIFGVPQGFEPNASQIILLVVRFFMMPISFLANSLIHVINLVIMLFKDLSGLLIWLGKMFVGVYNVPVYHNTNTYDWSTYIITSVS